MSNEANDSGPAEPGDPSIESAEPKQSGELTDLPPASESSEPDDHPKKPLPLLMLTALGVVYGDIGTSPLYALRESFHMSHGFDVNPETVLGVVSLITWSLIIVVSVKYLGFVLRADLHGEGGILTLTGLVRKTAPDPNKRYARILVLMGLFGAALLYGEGIITPAISVLSAVEGLNITTKVFEPYIIPITIGILIALFSIQGHGTERVGRVFGPITLIWFISLFALGLNQIVQHPAILRGFSPHYGLWFLYHHGWTGFIVLGSVVLVVTGAEALYADLGHFGSRPIRWAWFVVVLPSLLMNYYGQAALIIYNPSAVDNPFFRMIPSVVLYPMVVLATAATVIASQALISGSYSLTMQAIRQGFLPRLNVIHTSEHAAGQIYVPSVNWFLMFACIALVIGFRTSSNLAAAYGLAVTGAMATTTVLFYFVARNKWNWRKLPTLALCSLFMSVDLTFLSANVLKIPSGGWFPLLMGGLLFTVMTTWSLGREVLGKAMQPERMDLDDLFEAFRIEPPTRVEGASIFLSGAPHQAPPALLSNLKHFHVLHKKVILVSVSISDRAYVDQPFRIRCEELGHGFYQVRLRFGYMEAFDVPSALRSIGALDLRPQETTYYLGREIVIPTVNEEMSMWRERLFAFLSNNARNATAFFMIPPDRVVEVGSQIRM